MFIPIFCLYIVDQRFGISTQHHQKGPQIQTPWFQQQPPSDGSSHARAYNFPPSSITQISQPMSHTHIGSMYRDTGSSRGLDPRSHVPGSSRGLDPQSRVPCSNSGLDPRSRVSSARQAPPLSFTSDPFLAPHNYQSSVRMLPKCSFPTHDTLHSSQPPVSSVGFDSVMHEPGTP